MVGMTAETTRSRTGGGDHKATRLLVAAYLRSRFVQSHRACGAKGGRGSDNGEFNSGTEGLGPLFIGERRVESTTYDRHDAAEDSVWRATDEVQSVARRRRSKVGGRGSGVVMAIATAVWFSCS